MPEEGARPIGAVLVHQRKELRIVAKLHKRGKSAFPKEVAIIIRCTAKPTRNVLFSGLAKQENHSKPHQREWPLTTFCLVPSDEKKQVIDESHTYQNESTLPRKPFRLQRSAATFSCQACHMALRKCWMGPVIIRNGGRPGRIQPARSESQKKANFFSRPNNKMNGPMPKRPRRGIIQ